MVGLSNKTIIKIKTSKLLYGSLFVFLCFIGFVSFFIFHKNITKREVGLDSYVVNETPSGLGGDSLYLLSKDAKSGGIVFVDNSKEFLFTLGKGWGVSQVSASSFWNPDVCAGMPTLITKNGTLVTLESKIEPGSEGSLKTKNNIIIFNLFSKEFLQLKRSLFGGLVSDIYKSAQDENTFYFFSKEQESLKKVSIDTAKWLYSEKSVNNFSAPLNTLKLSSEVGFPLLKFKNLNGEIATSVYNEKENSFLEDTTDTKRWFVKIDRKKDSITYKLTKSNTTLQVVNNYREYVPKVIGEKEGVLYLSLVNQTNGYDFKIIEVDTQTSQFAEIFSTSAEVDPKSKFLILGIY